MVHCIIGAGTEESAMSKKKNRPHGHYCKICGEAVLPLTGRAVSLQWWIFKQRARSSLSRWRAVRWRSCCGISCIHWKFLCGSKTIPCVLMRGIMTRFLMGKKIFHGRFEEWIGSTAHKGTGGKSVMAGAGGIHKPHRAGYLQLWELSARSSIRNVSFPVGIFWAGRWGLLMGKAEYGKNLI